MEIVSQVTERTNKFVLRLLECLPTSQSLSQLMKLSSEDMIDQLKVLLSVQLQRLQKVASVSVANTDQKYL